MATLQEQINQQTSGSIAGMTVAPGQTQPEGTTGQLVQQAPEAPQQPPTPQVQLEQPTVSPTAISTDSMREQLKGAEDTLKNMQTEIDAGKMAAPIGTIDNQITNQKVDAGLLPESQRENIPQDPYQSEIAAYTTATNKILDERKNDFNRFLTRSDKLLKSQVRSIQKTFDVRRDQAQDVATNAIAASKVLGSRFGRQRYAPEIQAGIVTGKENDLISTLADIDAAEAAAMAAAEGAAFTRDYTTFLDQIDNLDTIRKERETTLNELESAMKEENERRATEAELAKNETQVIEQIAGGVTDPIEIFTALNGNVPFDVVKSYTDDLEQPLAEGEYGEGVLEYKTGTSYQPAGYFNTRTGEFIKLGGSAAVGASVATGGSVVGTGGAGVVGFPSDAEVKNMSTEARDFVNKVMRQLPTKLKDSEQEKQERMKEALFDFKRGRGIQEVVDEMNGFVIQDENGQALANVFRAYAVGSGVDLAEISAAVNNNNPVQAMTTIENAKLSDAEQFFGSIDEARNIVKLSDTILNLLKEVPTDKLGSFDGRAFKVGRFAGLTNEENLKVQQLETALATLNSPVRVSLIGTAGTEQEMQKITALQADILDQPKIIETIVSQFRTGVLDIHNEARSQRGLPTVSKEQLNNNEQRLALYESEIPAMKQSQKTNLSNSDLLLGGDDFSTDMDEVNIPSALDKLQ